MKTPNVEKGKGATLVRFPYPKNTVKLKSYECNAVLGCLFTRETRNCRIQWKRRLTRVKTLQKRALSGLGQRDPRIDPCSIVFSRHRVFDSTVKPGSAVLRSGEAHRRTQLPKAIAGVGRVENRHSVFDLRSQRRRKMNNIGDYQMDLSNSRSYSQNSEQHDQVSSRGVDVGEIPLEGVREDVYGRSVPVYVMLPLDTVNADGVFRYASAQWFLSALRELKNSGIHGVAVDVWVRLFES